MMTLSDVPTAPTVPVLSRPLERLEAEIVELSSQLTAATSRLLGLVGEFDAVEGGGRGEALDRALAVLAVRLISLCDAHHWLVHDGGWTIAVIRPGTWRFYAPDGRRLDTNHTPAAAIQPLPIDEAIEPDAVLGRWNGDSLDIHYATSILNQGADGRHSSS